jgi:thioredoxin
MVETGHRCNGHYVAGTAAGSTESDPRTIEREGAFSARAPLQHTDDAVKPVDDLHPHMSDSQSDDIEEIKQKKAEQLRSRLETPEEPVHVEGRDHLGDVVASNEVVIVDFYADWCGPCQTLEPVLESIAADTAATVAKVDVDRHQDVAGEFGVQGIPMLAVFADGEQVEELVGLQDEDTLVSLVEQYA